MQQSKIEWLRDSNGKRGYVWNPVTGCEHQCPYCYARKMANRLKGRYGYPADEPFKPTWHEEKLEEPYKLKGKEGQPKIFVCSMGDLFGEWITSKNIQKVINVAYGVPGATFIFLTKNPKRYSDFDFPKNAWIGYSTTGNLFHKWDERNNDNVKFVSLEPMAEPMHANLGGYAQRIDFQWLIIGQETGNRKEKHIVTSPELISTLDFARKLSIPIFVKNNLKIHFDEMSIPILKNCPQEYPKEEK